MPAQAGEWCSTMLQQWLVLTTEYSDVSYSAGSFYSAYYNFGSTDLEFCRDTMIVKTLGKVMEVLLLVSTKYVSACKEYCLK